MLRGMGKPRQSGCVFPCGGQPGAWAWACSEVGGEE
jgi:hypothetical protein